MMPSAFPARIVMVAVMPALAAPAQADDSFSGAGQQGEMDCEGGSATIEGASNEMVVTGACKLLTIIGASNRVRVTMARGGVIRITGVGNQVRWIMPAGARPRQRISGAGNLVSKGD